MNGTAFTTRLRSAAMLALAAIFGAASLADAQVVNSKDVNVVNTPNVIVANAPTVGIDSSNNGVRIANGASNPVPVTIAGSSRVAFQAGVNLEAKAPGNAAFARIHIPAGKRLVIEDVSAITFQQQGEGLLLRFTTAVQDLVGENNDRGGFEDHFLVLTSQGIYNGLEQSTAHQTMHVFADETVTTSASTLHDLDLIVSFERGGNTGTAGVRITFSGYLEDLPSSPNPQ